MPPVGVLLAGGYAAIRNGKIQLHKRFMISAFTVFNSLSGFLPALSLPRRARSFPRPRLDSTSLFRAAHFSHYIGDRDRPDDSHHPAARTPGSLRQTQDHRSLDAAVVVLCQCHRRDRLPDGLPNLFLKSRSLRTTKNKTSRRELERLLLRLAFTTTWPSCESCRRTIRPNHPVP